MGATPRIQFYLGANSPQGFYSIYEQLLAPGPVEDYFLLKGGPGCGKSTLMRRVGKAMEEHGICRHFQSDFSFDYIPPVSFFISVYFHENFLYMFHI